MTTLDDMEQQENDEDDNDDAHTATPVVHGHSFMVCR
jgi:hypothetical protein